MNELENSQIGDLRSQIEQSTDDVTSELPFELFDKQNNKTTKLLAVSEDRHPIDGRHRWYDYKFKQPQLISKITVTVSGYNGFSEFEFQWSDENGRKSQIKGKPVDGSLLIPINEICKKISFLPPSQWLANGMIVSVRVEGVTRENVGTLLDKLSDLESYKQEIASIIEKSVTRANTKIFEAKQALAERANTQKENAPLKSQQARLKKNVDDLSLKRNELLSQNTASDEALASLEQRSKQVQSTMNLNEKNSESIAAEILKKEKILKDLKSNINLFPTEIVEFVNQGSRNLTQYFWLALAPILILIIMFALLINGAADLSTIITENQNININAIVLSRLPYVSIALAIITASYKIARSFIMEMIKINNQRLSLTKISIIAKDVSAAAESELNLSDDEIYRLRTDLKMQLLRDHLKEYISKDFKVELPQTITLPVHLFEPSENDYNLNSHNLDT